MEELCLYLWMVWYVLPLDWFSKRNPLSEDILLIYTIYSSCTSVPFPPPHSLYSISFILSSFVFFFLFLYFLLFSIFWLKNRIPITWDEWNKYWCDMSPLQRSSSCLFYPYIRIGQGTEALIISRWVVRNPMEWTWGRIFLGEWNFHTFLKNVVEFSSEDYALASRSIFIRVYGCYNLNFKRNGGNLAGFAKNSCGWET